MAVGPLPLKRLAMPEASLLARGWPRAVIVAVAALCCLAILLALRRLTGALVRPLGPAVLVVCAAIVLSAGVAARLLVNRFTAWRHGTELVHIAATLALVLLAWSVSLPGSNPAALGLVWIAALLPEVAARLPWRRWRGLLAARGERTRICQAMLDNSRQPHAKQPESLSLEHAEELEHDEGLEQEAAEVDELEPSDYHILLQLTRSRDNQGQESVTGWCRVPFASGQRQAASHLAFCPPLGHAPRLEVEQLDGPPARIKVGQALAYGARIELKLVDAPVDSSEVVYRFHAR
jgi:hypothetical protein